MAINGLGGYFGSRLNRSIREELGLTYGIKASLRYFRQGSFFTISAQTSKENISRVISETINEIKNFSERPMGEDEFMDVKRYMQSLRASYIDSPFEITDYLIAQYINQQDSEAFNREQDFLESATPESIFSHYADNFKTDAIKILTVK